MRYLNILVLFLLVCSAPVSSAVTEIQTSVDIHQGITSNGSEWFANGSQSLHKWSAESIIGSDPDISRYDLLSDDPDFTTLGINHWGAPFIFGDYMYTVVKQQSSCGSNAHHYLARYSVFDLSYQGKVPIGDTQTFQLAGGPVITSLGGTDYFYVIKCGVDADRIYKFRLSDGAYCDGIACPSGDIDLTGKLPNRPQAISQDSDGNWLVMQSNRGLNLYGPTGVFKRRLFKAALAGASSSVHEGFYMDDEQNLTVAMTYGSPPVYKILKTNLLTDVYRYVDAVNGSGQATGYSPEDAVDTIELGDDVTMPGMTLRIKNFTRSNPNRSYPEPVSGGVEGFPVIYEGDGEPVYVTGSQDYSESAAGRKWNLSLNGSEYYLTNEAGLQISPVEVLSVATCPQADWMLSGLDCLVKGKVGVPGTLADSEWGWGDNDTLGFNTLYYRPAKGEEINSIHIEAGQRDPLTISKPYVVIRDFRVFFGNQYSVDINKRNNTIEQTVFRFGGAEGVLIRAPNARIENSVAYDGQVGFTFRGRAEFSSSYNNISYNNSNDGFAIDDEAQTVTIRNCISYDNRGMQFLSGQQAQATMVAENNSWRGANNEFFDNYLLFHDIGNLPNVDPELLDPGNGDFHLTSQSPLIDAGENSGAPKEDADGDVRPLDGDGDLIARVDIGVDEYIPLPDTDLPGESTPATDPDLPVDDNNSIESGGSGSSGVQASSDNSSGGGGGGCSINNQKTLAELGSDWWLILCMVGWLGIYNCVKSRKVNTSDHIPGGKDIQ